MERAAQEPVPDLTHDSEVEGESDDAAETLGEKGEVIGHGDDASSAGDHIDEDIVSPGDERLGGHTPASLARECKRAAAGTRVPCVACRTGGREVLTYLLTCKKGRQGGKASYQVLCDYHEPDIIARRDGRSHRLACRKTRKVETDTLESEYEAIRFFGAMGASRAMLPWFATRPSRYASGGLRGR